MSLVTSGRKIFNVIRSQFDPSQIQKNFNTPVTPRQPTRLTTTNAVGINRQEYGLNTCLGTTCHGSVVLRQVYTPYGCLLISVAFVVLCRVGCLGVIGVSIDRRDDAIVLTKLYKMKIKNLHRHVIGSCER